MVTKRLFDFARFRPIFLVTLVVSLSTVGWADVALNITPTFDSSITGLANAAAVEGVINSAINYYESTFTTHTGSQINVQITFQNMSTGLGQSNTLVGKVSYQNFINSLTAASSGDSTDTTALAHLPNGPNNPVNGSLTINVKTAECRALGLGGGGCSVASDGTIGLNTSITDVNAGQPFSLFAVTEHEIDEVLGLGSDAGSAGAGGFFDDPAAEDLFRYDSVGGRSFTTNSSAKAFFSLDGTTHIAQFDNQNDGGDFGDWQSNPLPSGVAPKVQDAFATAGSTPTLANDGGAEVIALDAIGYNLSGQAVPEPSFIWMLLVGFALLVGVSRVRGKMAARSSSES